MEDCPNIVLAAREGYHNLVKKFIQEGAEVNVKEDIFGFTALHWAIQRGWGQKMTGERGTEMIQDLVNAGADLEAKCNKLKTPLIVAAENGMPWVCKYLIERGADIEARDKYGKNFILSVANGSRLWFGGLRMQTTLVQWFSGITGVQFDFNARTVKQGYTALHLAARRGQVDICESFVHLGTDIKAQCRDGKTALLIAVEEHLGEVVQKLLDKGADPNVKDKNGVSPINYALKNRQYELVKKMCRAGVDIDLDLLMSDPVAIKVLRGMRQAQDKIADSSLYTCAKCEKVKNDLVMCFPCKHISLCQDCRGIDEDETVCQVCGAEVLFKAQPARTLNARTDCVVCTEKKRKPAVLLPCRHTGLCLDCANKLKTLGGRCPKDACNGQVNGVASHLSLKNRKKLLKLLRSPRRFNSSQEYANFMVGEHLYNMAQQGQAQNPFQPPQGANPYQAMHAHIQHLQQQVVSPHLDANAVELNWSDRDIVRNIEAIEKFMAENAEIE